MRMTHRKETMNLIKVKNNPESTKIHIIPKNEKPIKIIINTASNESLINKVHYNEIGTTELY